MRSVRNAAVAGATVLALALGTTTATAQESDAAETQAPSLSSQPNTSLNLEGDQDANGEDIFGSSKDLEDQPNWAKALYALTVLGTVGAFVGLIGGPLYNFVVHGPQA
ncbi:hypothetical protein [Corynebacterium doosanense]|uniref:Membrane protein n=1 Tax=Corynebacterium doosanense CAU 212 = DSM 45436 TaxID=558173 RepID=A0A097IGX2_9CORY|nr:hypothetical protein [Corynebacterium doosanense]AIT61347.1 membrane protein [Corynebacterium doosanense CAU 212 = DSM 45436]